MINDIREQINRVNNWEQFLIESIDGGSLIVYHRTDKNPFDFNKGFKSSQYGGAYGTGLYTFYDLDSATNEFNTKYGKYILEISIQNNGKYLILDPELLMKFYGANISLMGQLKKLFKGDFNNFYQENKETLDEIKNLDLSDRSDEGITNSQQILGALLYRCKGFIKVCDGVAFIDGRLGKVFVLYETNLMNPIRYSDDEGKTWVSIKNKSSFNIGKDNRSGEDKILNQKFSDIEP